MERVGRVIEKACESERKCACRDKYGSLESGCSRVKKVSADVETGNVMYRCCVGKLGRETGNIFRSVWDNWSASFSWSARRWSFGHGGSGFDPWAGLVPIRPEAWGQFVCTGRMSQRRTEAAWSCSSNPTAIEGVSAAVLHSLPLPSLFYASLHFTHPHGTKSKGVF